MLSQHNLFLIMFMFLQDFGGWTCYRKLQPLCTPGAESNLRDRVLGEVEKDSFITLPGKGRHTQLLPWKTMCPNLGGFDERFYNSDSKIGSLTRLWCEQCLHSLNLVSGGWSPNLDELLLVPLILPQVVSWLLLPWLATVPISPLELREGHGGWSLTYKKMGTERLPCQGAPQGLTRFQS